MFLSLGEPRSQVYLPDLHELDSTNERTNERRPGFARHDGPTIRDDFTDRQRKRDSSSQSCSLSLSLNLSLARSHSSRFHENDTSRDQNLTFTSEREIKEEGINNEEGRKEGERSETKIKKKKKKQKKIKETRGEKKGDGVTLALCMRRRLYPYERTRCRRAKLRTDSGYAGGLLLNEPPYWYRIPSTFCDPSTLDARPATFMDIADNIRRAPLAALRDLSAFLSYLSIISPPPPPPPPPPLRILESPSRREEIASCDSTRAKARSNTKFLSKTSTSSIVEKRKTESFVFRKWIIYLETWIYSEIYKVISRGNF